MARRILRLWIGEWPPTMEGRCKYRMAQKERMFLKWVVVGRVKVGDLPTPSENSAEGSVQ